GALEGGVVSNVTKWHFVDWVPEWAHGIPIGGEDAPVTVYSMLYAYTLGVQAEVCDACGRTGLALEYRERKAKMIENINRICFDKDKKAYVDVVGRKDFSMHTAVWAVLSDCVTGKDATDLIDRTFASTDVFPCSFSMNYYTFRAIEKAGRYDRYAKKLFDGWQKMLDMHSTTWCENPDDPRSECHGWSSTPNYEFSAMTLGVFPIENGYKSIRIKPHPGDLTYAQGRIPTPYGYIDVDWKTVDGKMTLHFKSNEKIHAVIELPDGRKQEVTASEYVI
ncbi:MAG: hypothetical protein MJ072_03110, partial [Clostridia bacterium]|nr:hypothetical protein [Clostridia bacterium]